MQSIEIQSNGKNCSVAKISEFFRIFSIFFEFFGIFQKLVRFARPPEDYSPIVLRAPNIFPIQDELRNTMDLGLSANIDESDFLERSCQKPWPIFTLSSIIM